MAPSAISPERDSALGTLTTTFDDTLRFYLNGTRVVLDEKGNEKAEQREVQSGGENGPRWFL